MFLKIIWLHELKKKTILFFNRNIKYHRTFHIIFFVLLWLDWGNESCFESFMMIISFMKPQLRSIVVLRRGRGGCHNQVMATHTIYYIARAICTLVFGNSSGLAVVNWFNLRDCHSLQFVTYAQHHCAVVFDIFRVGFSWFMNSIMKPQTKICIKYKKHEGTFFSHTHC